MQSAQARLKASSSQLATSARLFGKFLLRNHLDSVIGATVRANVVGQFQRVTLRTRDHMRRFEAQIMRPATIPPNS